MKSHLIKLVAAVGLSLCPAKAYLQNSSIKTEDAVHDYGEVDNVYKLQSDFVLRNDGNKNLFLLRADVPKDVKVWTSKKTIVPGDTVSVQIYYFPGEAGRFSHSVKLVTSADSDPFVLKIKGDVKSVKKDDKTACFYFKKPHVSHGHTTGAITMNPYPIKADSLKKKPQYWGLDTSYANLFSQPKETHVPGVDPKLESLLNNRKSDVTNLKTETKNPSQETQNIKPNTLLDPSKYKANNIIFLIDVSGSMIDSTKLRWLKISMKKLVENLRENDKITLVTYRDSVRCLAEGLNINDKEKLSFIIDSLRAKGLTRGNKAIHFALDLALKNYIENGNNQVILATDGEFTFRDHDYAKWAQKVGTKNVVLSTLAFGNDKKAMDNLKDISKKGKGSFIHIKSRKQANSAVFEEIESRSKI